MQYAFYTVVLAGKEKETLAISELPAKEK